MRGIRLFGIATLVGALAACGPGGHGNGGNGDGGPNNGPDANPSGTGSITGTVWAPGNAPGMVPAGQEIPVSEALIYVTQAPPDPIPDGVYCDQCQQAPGFKSTYADAKGHFQLDGVPAGTWWLVIQKAQFRLDQQVQVSAEFPTDLGAEYTTLPSEHDPANGKWLPHIALGDGIWDQMEDIAGKMDIGMTDASGTLISLMPNDHLDLYDNSADHSVPTVGTLNSLVTDLNKMKQYHIILVPCSDGDNSQLFSNPAVRSNIREFVKAGGKFFVTDWSGEWEDVPFPPFVVFDSGTGDTTDPNCTLGSCGDSDGFPAWDPPDGKAEDDKLAAWLDGQMGPSTSGTVSTISAQAFGVEAAYNHIASLGTVNIGNDPMTGMPVMETPKVWVSGTDPVTNTRMPMTVTFEPGGCGRVLYSTYHTAEGAHVGLVPQERVLLYLLMEIGTCKDGPVIGGPSPWLHEHEVNDGSSGR
jgi:hypothetical protein